MEEIQVVKTNITTNNMTQLNSTLSGKKARFLCLFLYLVIPIPGWFILLAKMYNIKNNQFLIVERLDGSTKEYTENGIHILSGILPWETTSKAEVNTNGSKTAHLTSAGSNAFITVPRNGYAVLSNYKVLDEGFHKLENVGGLQILNVLPKNCGSYISDNNSVIFVSEAYMQTFYFQGEEVERGKFFLLGGPINGRVSLKGRSLSDTAKFESTIHGGWIGELRLNYEITDFKKLREGICTKELITDKIIEGKLKENLKVYIDKKIQHVLYNKTTNNFDFFKEAKQKSEFEEVKQETGDEITKYLEGIGIKITSIFLNISPESSNEGMRQLASAEQIAKSKLIAAKAEAKAIEIVSNSEATRAKALSTSLVNTPDPMAVAAIMTNKMQGLVIKSEPVPVNP